MGWPIAAGKRICQHLSAPSRPSPLRNAASIRCVLYLPSRAKRVNPALAGAFDCFDLPRACVSLSAPIPAYC
jgi:hypothetical protein